MTFETKRLLLRPFTREDAPLLYAIAADPLTTRYLYFWGRVGSTPDNDVESFLARALSSPWEYCLVKKDTGETIGEGSLERLDGKTACVGWILLPAYRRQGYAHEMAERLMDWGFDTPGIERIIACCDGRNLPSQNVMKGLHMRFLRCDPAARPQKQGDETRGDEYTYEITKDEWLAFHGKDA